MAKSMVTESPGARPVGPGSAEIDGLVDIERLTDWLDANVPQLGNGRLTVRMIHGGTSNVILSLDRGNGAMVLRRPPAVPPPRQRKGYSA